MVNLPELIDVDSSLTTEYMGHDRFTIEDNKLIRTFPIYSADDSNAGPSGKTRLLTYGLYPGEAVWQLKIVRSEIID
jgi:hypothetical protein